MHLKEILKDLNKVICSFEGRELQLIHKQSVTKLYKNLIKRIDIFVPVSTKNELSTQLIKVGQSNNWNILLITRAAHDEIKGSSQDFPDYDITKFKGF